MARITLGLNFWLCFGILFLANGAIAQSASPGGFDPFRPVMDGGSPTPLRATPDAPANTNPRNSNFSPTGMDTRPANMELGSNTRVGRLQFKSESDRERFENCRAEAKANGQDIFQLDTAGAMINARYKTRGCADFVIETMLNSMELTMRDDPQALTEFQRSERIQNRYQELKKAYLITSKNTLARADDTPRSSYSISPSPGDTASMNMFSTPEQTNAAPEQRIVVQPKVVIPAEWWAQDYYFNDQARQNQAAYQRQQFNQRQPIGNAPTPLQNVMSQAKQSEQRRQGRGGAQPDTLPSFRTNQTEQ
jgi:hypothetical protein